MGENALQNLYKCHRFPKIMTNLEESDIPISLLEKIIVNFAFPTDLLYHTIKSEFYDYGYSKQTFTERAINIWQGKIDKYHKLLVLKRKYGGKIPDRVQNICKKSPCGYVRYLLAYLR